MLNFIVVLMRRFVVSRAFSVLNADTRTVAIMRKGADFFADTDNDEASVAVNIDGSNFEVGRDVIQRCACPWTGVKQRMREMLKTRSAG